MTDRARRALAPWGLTDGLRPAPPAPGPQVKGMSTDEILEIAVRPGWKKGTKITFQEKGEGLREWEEGRGLAGVRRARLLGEVGGTVEDGGRPDATA